MRKLGISLVLSSVAVLGGCGPKDLTPEQRAYLSKLDGELSHTKSEIESAKQAAASYSGGLIKALIATRVEVLQTNQALIEQRMLAVESGSPVKVETTASVPDEALASSIAGEIQSVKTNINAAKIDAANYSGGIILSLKLSAIATTEQSLAMLEQRYLVAKFGLNPYSSTCFTNRCERYTSSTRNTGERSCRSAACWRWPIWIRSWCKPRRNRKDDRASVQDCKGI